MSHTAVRLDRLLARRLGGGDGGRLSCGRGLVDEGLVDVGDNTTSGNGCLDEGVELLVSSDGQKKMSGRDTLHLEVLAGIAGKLKHLCGEVLHDGGSVDRRGGTHSLLGMHASLQESVDTTDRELQAGSRGPGLGRALAGRRLAAFSALATFASFAAFSASSEIHD